MGGDWGERSSGLVGGKTAGHTSITGQSEAAASSMNGG